jgi:hypothetical protein
VNLIGWWCRQCLLVLFPFSVSLFFCVNRLTKATMVWFFSVNSFNNLFFKLYICTSKNVRRTFSVLFPGVTKPTRSLLLRGYFPGKLYSSHIGNQQIAFSSVRSHEQIRLGLILAIVICIENIYGEIMKTKQYCILIQHSFQSWLIMKAHALYWLPDLNSACMFPSNKH